MRYYRERNGIQMKLTAQGGHCHAEHLATPLDVSGWLHSHEEFELYLNVYGGKSLIIGDEIHGLRRGSAVLICPNDLHGHYFRGTLQGYERASVYFSPSYLIRATHGYLTASVFEELVSSKGHFFLLDEPLLLQVLRLIEEIQESYGKAEPLAQLRTATSLSDILLLFLKHATPDKVTAANPPPSALLVHSVMMYINEHFTDALSLSSVAQHFAISRSYLSHLFTENCGHSVYDYVQQKRITYAKQLIDRNEALTAVAIKCGFQDYSCFLRAFSKRVGASPNQYRKRRHNA